MRSSKRPKSASRLLPSLSGYLVPFRIRLQTQVQIAPANVCRRSCVATRIRYRRNRVSKKWVCPHVSRELRCRCAPGRGVDRERLRRCQCGFPDCATVEPGARAQRDGLDLRLRDGSAYDAALIHRGTHTTFQRIRLRRGNCRRFCGTLHRNTVRQVGAAREEEASTPRRCANGVTSAMTIPPHVDCRAKLIGCGVTDWWVGEERGGSSSNSPSSTIPRRCGTEYQLTTLCQETSTRELSSILNAEMVNCKPAQPHYIGVRNEQKYAGEIDHEHRCKLRRCRRQSA
jgi:hypothetical protein